MLGRLHQCLWIACLVLSVAHAHGQTLPTGVYGPYDGSPPMSGEPVDPNIVQELLPADRGLWWDVDLRLNQAIQDTSHGMWFRLEYLNTNIDNPGHTLLGAPLANIPDPRQPFDILVPTGTTTGQVLDTSSVRFNNINGIRGTIGIPLAFGHVEGVFWGTQNSVSRINTDLLPATNPFQQTQVIATSLLTNGQPGSTVLLYDAAFQAKYGSNVLSGEANIYYGYQNPTLGLRQLPVAGFRYIGYDESLNQQGAFDNRSGVDVGGILINPIVHHINSAVDNNLFALQTGWRTEFTHQFFTLGAEPKVGLGWNHARARVKTIDLRDSPFPPVVDDGLTTSTETRNLLTPFFDFGVYGKIHLNQSFHLRIGWNYTLLSNMSRADNNIYYNDNGTANPPAVRARMSYENLWLSSFSIGGEWILP
ncbi:MAG: BBP7 family outer membrane beta-barrel protein [Planctomycetaceae bacterium]